MCICLYLWHSWIEAAQRPTLRVLLRETGSIIDIRLAPYKWLIGCYFSNYSGYGIYNGGALTVIKRNN
jgi:hypothetical protein